MRPPFHPKSILLEAATFNKKNNVLSTVLSIAAVGCFLVFNKYYYFLKPCIFCVAFNVTGLT